MSIFVMNVWAYAKKSFVRIWSVILKVLVAWASSNLPKSWPILTNTSSAKPKPRNPWQLPSTTTTNVLMPALHHMKRILNYKRAISVWLGQRAPGRLSLPSPWPSYLMCLLRLLMRPAWLKPAMWGKMWKTSYSSWFKQQTMILKKRNTALSMLMKSTRLPVRVRMSPLPAMLVGKGSNKPCSRFWKVPLLTSHLRVVVNILTKSSSNWIPRKFSLS